MYDDIDFRIYILPPSNAIHFHLRKDGKTVKNLTTTIGELVNEAAKDIKFKELANNN